MPFGIFPEVFHTQISWNSIKNRRKDWISALQFLQGSTSLLDDAQGFLAWPLPLPSYPLWPSPLLPLANQGGPPGLCTYYLFCQNGLPSNPFLFGELLLMFQDSVQKSVLVSFSYSCHHLKEAFLTIFKIVTPAPRAPCSPPLLYFPFWHSLLLQRPYHYFICIVCHLLSVSRVQNVCCTRPRIIVIVLGSQGLAYSRCSRIVDKW